jgi:predicted phage terminase large subunit-like protein
MFLTATQDEVFLGGARGGGKSEALLIASLQYVNVPDYSAIIFRRTYSDLSLPGALMDRAQQWLGESKAKWNDRTKSWRFPSGATVSFGYMDTAADHFRYDGSHFQTVCFDELTQFLENQYLYLFTRMRRLKGSNVPIRMLSAGMPGGIGHRWVRERFITGSHPDRLFIPSTINDNPALDKEEYLKALMRLDPVTRRQSIDGDWSDFEGGRFRRDWFRRFHETENTFDLYRRQGDEWKLVASYPKERCWRFGTCDPAATSKKTSDWTVGVAWCVTPKNELLCLEVVRKHLEVEQVVPELALLCTRRNLRYLAIEEVGFQRMVVEEARRTPGIPAVRGVKPGSTDKLQRAMPAIVRAESGQIYLPEKADWLEEYVHELTIFTGKDDAHDDQVDATAWAALEMDRMGSGGYSDGIAPKKTATSPALEPRRLEPSHQSKAARRRMFGL